MNKSVVMVLFILIFGNLLYASQEMGYPYIVDSLDIKLTHVVTIPVVGSENVIILFNDPEDSLYFIELQPTNWNTFKNVFVYYHPLQWNETAYMYLDSLKQIPNDILLRNKIEIEHLCGGQHIFFDKISKRYSSSDIILYNRKIYVKNCRGKDYGK